MDPDDCFALFGLPRAAYLDETALRESYHQHVRERIDATTGGGEEGRDLHRAYEILADPVQRIRHLLRLIDPARKPAGTVLSGDLLELFAEIGSVLPRADGLLARVGQTTSFLGRALLAGEEAELQLALQNVLGKLTGAWEEETGRLATLASAEAAPLEAALGRLRTLQKWKGQVQERLLKFLG
jgi:hypothetical protein